MVYSLSLRREIMFVTKKPETSFLDEIRRFWFERCTALPQAGPLEPSVGLISREHPVQSWRIKRFLFK